MNNVKEDTVTHKEAAKLLGVHANALYRWRRAGKISFVEFPKNTYRYKKEDITRILEEGLPQ